MAHTYEKYKEGYDEDIERMVIDEDKKESFDKVARRAIANKKRYQDVAKQVGTIPWQLIAVLHNRESGMDFTTHLHNGDPLTRRTYHVPAGRPIGGKPPFTWEFSAIDALKQKGLQNITEWPLSRIAYEAERYNGFGYRNRGVPSPYLWAGTNIYTRGKYVSDGKFDRNAVDRQLGVAPLMARIVALDVSTTQIAQASRKLTLLSRVKASISATFGGYLTLDYFNAIPDYISKYQALGLPKEIFIIAGLIALMWGVFTVIEKYTIQDYTNGNYTPKNGAPENEVSKDIVL